MSMVQVSANRGSMRARMANLVGGCSSPPTPGFARGSLRGWANLAIFPADGRLTKIDPPSEKVMDFRE